MVLSGAFGGYYLRQFCCDISVCVWLHAVACGLGYWIALLLWADLLPVLWISC